MSSEDGVDKVPKKFTVSIPDEDMRAFIAQKKEEGTFKSRSHVIQEAVRIMMRDENKGPLT